MIVPVNRLRALLLPGVLLLALAPALAVARGTEVGAASHSRLWQPLGIELECGLAIHAPGKPVSRLLCSGPAIPAPRKGVGIGDPGFVFLGAHGRPVLARLSQDSFEGSGSPLTLAAGSTWSAHGVRCTTSVAIVRCVNRAGHGFSASTRNYRAF